MSSAAKFRVTAIRAACRYLAAGELRQFEGREVRIERRNPITEDTDVISGRLSAVWEEGFRVEGIVIGRGKVYLGTVTSIREVGADE